MAKKQTLVGIDQDSGALRGARLSYAASGRGSAPVCRLLSFAEVAGDLLDAAKFQAALKKLKDKLGVSATDTVSTCLSGKQTYAAQMDTAKRLPEDEMAGMLRLELRNSMSFDAASAAVDFQFLPSPAGGPREEGVQVMVSAVSGAHLNRHLSAYGRAGIKPGNVNVLPISVANAFWSSRRPDAAADGDGETHVLLHVGADTCTLVIDGIRTPFFTRSFAFDMNDAVSGGEEEGGIVSSAALQAMDMLSIEIMKSVTYYKNTNAAMGVGDIPGIIIIGVDAANPIFRTLESRTGYAVETIRTAESVRSLKPPEAGKFDLAIALALQGAED